MQPLSHVRAAAALALLVATAVGCYPVKSPASSPAPSRSTSPKGAPAASVSQQGNAGKSGTEKKSKDREKNKEKRDRKSARREYAGHLSEGNLVALVLAYNNADISYARIAVARSKNASVRGFARRLITDAAGINQRALDLVRQRGDIDPEENEMSLAMREISAARRDQLKALSGPDFDASFINGEISYHRSLLARIDEEFLPAARDEDLEKLLTTMRPAVAAHLAQAQQIGVAMDPGEAVTSRR